MAPPSKAQLIAELAQNAEEIKEAVSHLSGKLSKQQWSEAMQALFKLKAVQADIEYKLHLVSDSSRK